MQRVNGSRKKPPDPKPNPNPNLILTHTLRSNTRELLDISSERSYKTSAFKAFIKPFEGPQRGLQLY